MPNLVAMYPGIQDLLQQACDTPKLNEVSAPKYQLRKERILASAHLLSENAHLDEEQRIELVTKIMENGPDKSASMAGALVRSLIGTITGSGSSSPSSTDVPRAVLEVHDRDFLPHLAYYAGAWPPLAEYTMRLARRVQKYFFENVKKEARALQGKIQNIQRSQCKDQIERKFERDRERQLQDLRVNLLKTLSSSMIVPSTSR